VRIAPLSVRARHVIHFAAAIVGAAAAALPSSGAPPAAQTPATPRPALIVMIVVDQMRADYVDRFSASWTGGFARLSSQGAWFRNAAYPYAETMTCAGHATIATGVFPHTHGIIQNEWPVGDRREEPTCVDDPAVADVGYLAPPTGGHSARQLIVPTFADLMRAGGSHVAVVSLKADAAIALAGHGGDAVTWINDRLDGLATSRAYTSQPVPAVTTFAQANPIEAYFRRTWDRLLPAAGYTDADAGIGEAVPRGWTTSFPHVLNGGGRTPDVDFRAQWLRSPFVDEYIGRLAASLVDSMRLGKSAGTDVLAVSFSATDEVGHIFGPRSQEIQDTLARLDRTLGSLFDRLDTSVGRNRYVVALTSDHGVTPIPEQARREGRNAGRLDPTDVADAVDARLAAAWGRGRYVAALAGSNMNLYFMPGVYDRLRASPGLADDIVRTIQVIPGVYRVLKAEQVRDVPSSASADPIVRAVALSYYPGRSGDLLIVLKPGWNSTAYPSMHGSPWPDDQRVPLFLMGAGIKAGQFMQSVTPADIAPTLAVLTGLTMPKSEGRPLREALN
jgi:predicted AlkP superfamily pyrophosphatase or phosphodiesterase